MLTGPDVSNLQGDVDMHAVRATGGHSFVGIKTGEGGDFLDACLKRNRDRARAEGLIRLLYHFARPGNGRGFPIGDPRSAVIEADWFLHCIGQLEPGEIAFCDLEDPNVPAGVDLTAWLLTFLATVDEETGRAPAAGDELYTFASYATTHLRLRPTNAPTLWLAAYNTSPVVPAPWSTWTFHQYTSSGSCPGVTGRCDLSRFSGPYSALQALAGITQPPTFPPEENVQQVTLPATPDGVPIDVHAHALDGSPIVVNVHRDDVISIVPTALATVSKNVGIDGKTYIHAQPACDVDVTYR